MQSLGANCTTARQPTHAEDQRIALSSTWAGARTATRVILMTNSLLFEDFGCLKEFEYKEGHPPTMR